MSGYLPASGVWTTPREREAALVRALEDEHEMRIPPRVHANKATCRTCALLAAVKGEAAAAPPPLRPRAVRVLLTMAGWTCEGLPATRRCRRKARVRWTWYDENGRRFSGVYCFTCADIREATLGRNQ